MTLPPRARVPAGATPSADEQVRPDLESKVRSGTKWSALNSIVVRVAGFAVGVVEKSLAIDGHSIVAGDALIGLAADANRRQGAKRSQREQTDQPPAANAPMQHRTCHRERTQAHSHCR